MKTETRHFPPQARLVAYICLYSYIEKLHLLDGQYLKRAAALLFHPDPERFVTGAFVKIGFFRTNTDLLYQDEIHGDLFSQVEKTMDLLLTKYLRAGISYVGIQRVETFPVPEAALREAILNAVIHKDYGAGAPIQIGVYPDKVKLWNPGELPDTWTLARLMGKHPSQPFNPDIANVFFRVGMIEAWGRGIERIFETCKSAGVSKPELRCEDHGLWVSFWFASSMAVKMAVETSGKTSGKIVDLIRKNPNITIPELAQHLGKTPRAIELQVNKLKAAEIIGRVGPAKGGHWKVLK